MSPIIRPARPDEADTLTALARAAKASWGYPEAWLREWEPVLTFTATSIADHATFVADADGEVLGVVAVENTTEPEITHLWVAPQAQGRGIGRQLVQRARELAQENHWPALRIESDPYAVPFYESLGAEHIGDVPAPVAGTERVLPVFRLASKGES